MRPVHSSTRMQTHTHHHHPYATNSTAKSNRTDGIKADRATAANIPSKQRKKIKGQRTADNQEQAFILITASHTGTIETNNSLPTGSDTGMVETNNKPTQDSQLGLSVTFDLLPGHVLGMVLQGIIVLAVVHSLGVVGGASGSVNLGSLLDPGLARLVLLPGEAAADSKRNLGRLWLYRYPRSTHSKHWL